jgi:enoyl-CoA hydratase/carnithine racemase
MPPARLGIVYPPEGLERFVRVVGLSTARKLFYTARYFAGPELFTMGMLDFLCPEKSLEAFTMELAAHMTSNSPVSMRGHKRILGMLAGPGRLEEDAAGEAAELVSSAMHSADALEGIVAFSDRRDPRFAPGAEES